MVLHQLGLGNVKCGLGFGKDGADFVAGAAFQSLLGEGLAIRVRETAHLCFDGGDRRQAHAQFVYPEPEKDRHGLRVTSDASADSNEPVMLAGAFDGLPDET